MSAKKDHYRASGKELRLRAEKRLKDKTDPLTNMTADEMKYVIHELNVHQIELEMQNEQLQEARQELEFTVSKYSDLFNFAPVAYLIMDQNGKILEANNTACQMLETDKNIISNHHFHYLVDRAFVDTFHLFFKKVFSLSDKQTCELDLNSFKKQKFNAQLICSPHTLTHGPLKTCKLAIIDITEQRKALEIIRASLLEKDRLNLILNTQEQERRRIAEALHNGVGQILYAIKIKVDQLLKEKQSKDESSDITSLIREAIDDVKNISYELVPTTLEDFGLEAVIQKLCKKLSNADIRYDFNIYGYDRRLSLNLEIAIFRIVQELINNIVKHSGASSAGIFITVGENILLRVEDNGVGYVPSDSTGKIDSSGLRNIRNRVQLLDGYMEVKSEIRKGTFVLIKIPRTALN
jgi:PAS domain S-box-containing protein